MGSFITRGTARMTVEVDDMSMIGPGKTIVIVRSLQQECSHVQ